MGSLGRSSIPLQYSILETFGQLIYTISVQCMCFEKKNACGTIKLVQDKAN